MIELNGGYNAHAESALLAAQNIGVQLSARPETGHRRMVVGEFEKLSHDCHRDVAQRALIAPRNSSRDVDKPMLKFLVFSDIHLVDTGATSHGLDTHSRFSAGIDWVNTHHADADFCVLAGDLADLGFQGATEPYQRLKDQVARLTVPCHITIGNHDNRDTFLAFFGEGLRAETGCIDKVIDAKGHRTILLDSVVEGPEHTHGGALSRAQLEWLAARLGEHPGPVNVILHHHANPLHTMVDRIRLEAPEAFAEVLKTHGDIRQVIAGHVHYTSTAMWHGIPFTTLAGSHYGVTVPLNGAERKIDRLWGPAQMAVVLCDDDQTLVHFENYLDGNPVLS
ncbi:MAG: metallophosphoesterase [Rhodobacteraceae bacterium]|nr:metallophosphoesterase [Paracoccaceae bacterium]